jgi:CRP/FNR family cyclic AMP-dependent transcriptional regulator
MGLLGDSLLLQTLADAQVRELEGLSELKTFKRGAEIFSPGDAGDSLFLLSEGRVKLVSIKGAGKEFTLAYHTAGDLFGESALMSNDLRTCAAVAVQKSRIWLLPTAVMREISLKSPAFVMEMSSLIAQRRSELENRLESLVFRDVPARLADQLLRLAEIYGVEKNFGGGLSLKFSQQELASLIGATRETTSTAINEMKRQGILDTSHRMIIIKDAEALEELRDRLL